MTFEEMTGKAQILLDDIKGERYSPAQLTAMLNQGMRRSVRLLNESVTQELDVSALSQTIDSNSAFDITSLSPQPEGNIMGLRAVILTGGEWCTRISYTEYLELDRRGDKFPACDPIYYVRGNLLYPKPATASTTQIDIYYRKELTLMGGGVAGTYTGCAVTQVGDSTAYIHIATGLAPTLTAGQSITLSGCINTSYNGAQTIFAVTSTGFIVNVTYVSDDTATLSYADTECMLNENLHDIIVGMSMEDYVDTTVGAARAYSNARQQIEDMNIRYPMSESHILGRCRDAVYNGSNYMRNVYTG